MIIIGITGGMASGKSTIARMLARHGMVHLDADALVHRLMATDKNIIAAVGRQFQGSVTGGKIDRKALSAMIAGDNASLKRLEQLLHPRVRAAEKKAILRARHQRRRAMLLDIPLLYETGADRWCDVVIAAYAPRALRRRRALARGTPAAVIDRLMARQLSDAECRRRADIIIPTTIGKAHTHRHVRAFLRQWGLA